jgi:hypothetical protein
MRESMSAAITFELDGRMVEAAPETMEGAEA